MTDLWFLPAYKLENDGYSTLEAIGNQTGVIQVNIA